MSSKSVIIVGGGLAALSSALALAEAGVRVRLFERRPYLGGRASSYLLPDGEHIDNCQHVTMGCCTNLADFYRRIGNADRITYYDRLTFVAADGSRNSMESSVLPPPLHLAPSFALYPSLTAADRNGIARAMLEIARRGGKNGEGDAANMSMLDWLRAHGQTSAAISRFWSVVLVSALDEDLDRTDVRYGLDVFWKAFLANREGYRIGVPRVPLGEFYDGCREALERRGGEVALRAPVRRLLFVADRIAGIEMDGGRVESADLYVLAVPHDVVLELLPEGMVDREPQFANLRRLRTSPITGVHLWFDREVMAEPFLTLLDRTTQWVFNKSRLYGDSGGGQYLQLVISASYGLIRQPRQEIILRCLEDLKEALPAFDGATLVKATVVKETSATFSPEPGVDRWRPPQRTHIPDLFLAGDWTSTGWPATMEGAVRSGYLAAEAILESIGEPKKVLQPDLPAEGLSRLWAQA